jgi:cyanate lyase
MDANRATTGPLAGLPSACHVLLDAKAKKGALTYSATLTVFVLTLGIGLSFEEISQKIGKPEVWTAALFYGQAKVRRFPSDIPIFSLTVSAPILPARRRNPHQARSSSRPVPRSFARRTRRLVHRSSWRIMDVASEGSGFVSAV